jgi:hypothetical protein
MVCSRATLGGALPSQQLLAVFGKHACEANRYANVDEYLDSKLQFIKVLIDAWKFLANSHQPQ